MTRQRLASPLPRLAELVALDGSFAARTAATLLEHHKLEEAHAIVDGLFDAMPNVEAAAHLYDWPAWARPKQLAPPGDWQTWINLCARGVGKTLSLSNFVNTEVAAGRASLIGLAAQDESNTIKVQVLGPSGLIATAPPWFKPKWEASAQELVWPNGARAYVRTPEVPGKIRGLEYELFWACEVQSWPAATRDEAWMNVLVSTRKGYARVVVDCTPKRRHPILRKMLRNCELDPTRHVLTKARTRENVLNLGPGYLDKLEAEIGGTQQGREELEGEMLDEADGATTRQVHIDDARRQMPERFTRTVIGVDPAVTSRAGNDQTGIIVDGLGLDGQCYVLRDRTGRYKPEEWAKVVLDEYVAHKCDLAIVETNKAGDFPTQNLRAVARERGLSVVVLGKGEKPRAVPGVVNVREVYAKGEKADRAKPLGTAYERGRISHVIGVDLTELEDVLTTWVPEPGARSPDRLDAHVHAAVELLGLSLNAVDPKQAFQGIEKLAAAANAPAPDLRRSIAALFGGRGNGGGRI